jgi:hypothetical protein
MKTLLILSMIVASFQFNASAFDVYGRGTKFIKVTTYNKGQLVGFELCQITHIKSCTRIGSRQMYSKVELENLRRSEGKDVVLAVLADVGIGVVLFYGGALAGGAIVASAGGIAPVGVAAGALTGAGTTTALAIHIDAINPAEQYRQTRMLRQDVISDETVRIDRNIDDIAHTLRTVLSHFDQK